MLANDVLNPVGSMMIALQPDGFRLRLHEQQDDELSFSKKDTPVMSLNFSFCRRRKAPTYIYRPDISALQYGATQ